MRPAHPQKEDEEGWIKRGLDGPARCKRGQHRFLEDVAAIDTLKKLLPRSLSEDFKNGVSISIAGNTAADIRGYSATPGAGWLTKLI